MASGEVKEVDLDEPAKQDPICAKRHSKNSPLETGYSLEKQQNFERYLRTLKEDFKARWIQMDQGTVGRNDFDIVLTLGNGSFGVVYLVNLKSENKYFAMKALEKHKIMKLKQIEHTLSEKKVLQAIKFPFVVSMEYFFKDNSHLYLVLPFVIGGEMFTHLRKMRKFEESLSKFYASQVLLALEYLHTCDLIYRDLKPENILIESNGYLKITDFGFCRIIKGRTWTLCGTPEYLAPEIILSKGYGFSADWWSFGVLIYEMTAGRAPFYSSHAMKIYEKIVSAKYSFPRHFSRDLRDIIQNTLQLDISRRFGVMKNGVLDFKSHAWFKEVNWDAILNNKYISPLIPKFKSAWDTSNFYKCEAVEIGQAPRCLYEDEFKEF